MKNRASEDWKLVASFESIECYQRIYAIWLANSTATKLKSEELTSKVNVHR